ncbi:outer membrane protein OmpA-like peptidoglycan-associated protein/tetratricopeptide (TPR) repeat protein [Flavobacterium nitrogenifigens]|uniref:Outer membrane protein OmpA-like peptidoglycan-associated protein/tetratricopeptide (TPR) repeat protein n=2 Tax=Flavobacterium TaxID=237 RepID=A0A7W7N699_9FLAO|nr:MULTISPECIES: OmpA family protein [Flavobacterium]MBB4800209.1 outer membrane protein OmpA-like peptidoglycan-associated protein/tetratricopeptide (TPR) repeat protein [Flavobacterium nitrogenifigens]MBB6386041.1 outer membrane protein OmpA-like peptidoglycan-associated protein/tetratricopeptide (TPR) repeat protein [Flavobacterium notoginsengisoli]
MKLKKIILIVLLCSFFLNVNAQNPFTNMNVKYADKKYEEYAYADAIKAYESVIEKESNNEGVVKRLANSYYFNGELTSALKWYEQLFLINEDQEAEYFYRYAQCLKSAGNYRKSDEVLEKFNKKAATEKRSDLIRNDKNYLEIIKENSGRFQIADAGVNSRFSDYGSTVYNNKIIFTSARDTGGVVKANFQWTNRSFSRLYSAVLMPDGSIGKPELFIKRKKDKFNESTPIFTKDGRTMYFTRNNFTDGKRGQNDKNVTLLKLYKADLIDDEWKNIRELPFNSDQYSTAHPALSMDEKFLYFASDMPGTLGQSDIYKVAINEDGSFGTPENLGPEINTEGRETFPFISGDNELYFASDGRPGLGGLDIFASRIKANGTYDEVLNVGEPVNSKQDDFAFSIDSRTRSGYFSSNRQNSLGLDDIYRFTETRRLICEQNLSGTVTDSESNAVLANTALTLFNEKFDPVGTITTDEKGNYVFPAVKCGKKYTIRTSKTDYNAKEVSVNILRDQQTTLMIALNKVFVPLTAKTVAIKKVAISPVKLASMKVGVDVAKLLNLPMNFFDLGKATIKKTSEPQLMKVVNLLKEYPDMKLDIRSHTDSRSSSESNQILSDMRALSTKKWLVQKGISEDRLTAKGYGETQLVNKCADGVKCTEKEHMQNRRSEFIIVAM